MEERRILRPNFNQKSTRREFFKGMGMLTTGTLIFGGTVFDFIRRHSDERDSLEWKISTGSQFTPQEKKAFNDPNTQKDIFLDTIEPLSTMVGIVLMAGGVKVPKTE